MKKFNLSYQNYILLKIFKIICLWIILIIILLLFSVSCDKSELTYKDKIQKYRNLIKATDDSILIAAQDTASFNAILAKLTKQYNFDKNKIIFERDPFVPAKISKIKKLPNTSSINKTKKIKKPLYSLTGIISIGTTKKALLNGDLYEVGDKIKINNAKIIKIEKQYITLKTAKRTFNVNLKKN